MLDSAQYYTAGSKKIRQNLTPRSIIPVLRGVNK